MEVDGWVTSVQRSAFPLSNLVYHREMCPPTTHCSTSGDHLLGRSLWSSVLGCLVIVQHQHQHQQRARPGVIPACSMQPASRPEASWPSALPARSIHVTPLPPSDRAAGVSLSSPRLVSSAASYLVDYYLTQVPYLTALCPLLVSLGSAPGSRVARPRRNTATLASPPWLLMHGQWLMSFGLGGDKKLYAIAAMGERKDNTQPAVCPYCVRFRRVDSTRLGSTQFDSTRLPTAVADLPNFQVCFTVDPGRTATPSHQRRRSGCFVRRQPNDCARAQHQLTSCYLS